MKLNNRIDEKLKESKWYHRTTAITLVVSLLCAFFVSLDLVMPGAALSPNLNLSSALTVSSGETAYFVEPEDNLPSEAENIADNITGLTITYGGETYTSPNGDDYTITIDAGSDDTASLSLVLDYEYSNDGQLQQVITSGYVYYYLPKGLKLGQSYYGVSSAVTDTKYSTTKPSGYYSIDQETGLMLIRFTDDYIDYLRRNSNGFKGKIGFKATVERDESADGDKIIAIGEGKIQLNVEFDDTEVSLNKSGTSLTDGDGTKYILWTITVTDPKGYVKLNGYKIEDVIEATLNNNTSKVDWSDSNVIKNLSYDTTYLDYNNGTFTFKNVGTYPETLTITYKQYGIVDGTNYKNSATIYDSDNYEKDKKEPEIKIENALEISKSGKAGYLVSSAMANDGDDEIQWTINVKNKSGSSLNKAYVTDEAFKTASNLAVYYTDANGNREQLGSGYYTLDTTNGTITFGENAPSNVEIVYETAAAIGNTYANSARVDSSETNNPPASDSTSDITVEYKNETSVSKSGSFDNDTSKLSWKITVNSNSNSDGSLEDLNGYVIQDDAFKGMNVSDITFNAFYATNGSETGLSADYVTLYLDSETGKLTVKVNTNAEGYDENKPLNKLEFFYTKDLTTDQAKTYASGAEQTISNTATATGTNGHTGTDTGDVNIKSRVEAGKVYQGTKQNESVVGMTDKTARIMPWKITLVKDSGFASSDMILQDILSDTDAENVSHYMTTDQLGAITLYGAATRSAPRQKIDSSLYKVTAQTDTASGKIIEYTIEFLNGIDSYGYHYIDVEYSTTADINSVKNGETVTYSNDYTYGTVTGSVEGLTFERKDPKDVEKITLTLNKKWADGNNIYAGRPESITVTVYRVKANADGSAPDFSTSTWDKVGDYTLTNVSKSKDSDNLTIGDDFPQWAVEGEAPNQTAVRYYYHVVEEPVTGYTSSATKDQLYAESSNGSFELTNTTTQQYGKRAVDVNGNAISSITTDELEIVTIDGTDYYIFGWDVIVNKVGDKSTVVYEDTLPEGAIYITGSESGLSAYTPIAYLNSGWHPTFGTAGNEYIGTAVQDGTKLTLTFKDELLYLRYYTAIPVSSVGSGDVISNTVKKDGDTTGCTAEVTIHKVVDPNFDEDLVKKEALNSAIGGYLNYGIEVNPDEKLLSNDNTYDITDILTLDPTSTKTMDDLDVSLYSIKVYPYNDDGTVNTSEPLDASQYSYTVNYKTEEVKTIDVSDSFVDGCNHKKWKLTGWEEGEQIQLKIQGTENHNYYYDAVELRAYSTNQDGSCEGENNDFTKLFAAQKFDANGEITGTVTVPEDTKTLYLIVWQTHNNVHDVKATAPKVTPATLNISVPDQKHLYIEYTYVVTGYTAGDENEKIYFSNTASVKSDNASGGDTEKHTQLNVNESSASSEAKTFPQIYKVDVSNYALNDLTATFKVAKYIDGQWVYASNVHTVTDSDVSHREFTFPTSPYTGYLETNDTYPTNAANLVFAAEDNAATANDDESVHNFNLTSGTLYKFVETVAPSGNYSQPDWSTGKTFADNENFVFYYKYGATEVSIPTEIASKVITIQEQSTINIPNNQKINLNAVKTFSGQSSNIPESASVKLKLYWSVNKTGNVLYEITGNANSSYDLDVPNGFSAERIITYTGGTTKSSTTAEWISLPSGRNGSPIYYIVREESYTIGGTEYTYNPSDEKYYDSSGNVGTFTPVYTKNGTNSNGTTIEVNNAEGIVVKKLWVDLNGNTVTPPNEPDSTEKMAIAFEVYGINSGGRVLYYSGTLTSDKNYEMSLPSESNGYKLSDFANFEIKEILTDAQTSALYLKYQSAATRKITDGVGTLELINTNITTSTTKAEVQKVWSDGAAAHTSDSVNVYLIQSTSVITGTQLKQIQNGTLTTGFNTGESIKDGNEVLIVLNGKTRETELSGVESITINDTTIVSGEVSGGKLNITGISVGSTDATVTMSDGATADYKITVIETNATLDSNNWIAEWSNLPYTYIDDDENEGTYYYYVIEKSSNASEEYTSSYRVNGKTTIITNSKPSELKVQKKWLDSDGNEITSSSEIYEVLPDTIEVQLYQKLKTETMVDSSTQTSEKPSRMKVAALGDSITNGSYNGVAEQYRYWYVLQEKLRNGGFTSATVQNLGVDQEEISHMLTRVLGQGSDKNVDFSNLDVLCLLAGTNDVMHGSNISGITKSDGTTISGALDKAPDRFEYLCRQIFEKANAAGRTDFKLYVGTIPYITKTQWFSYPNENATQAIANAAVKSYNDAITGKVNTLKGEGFDITLVDVNSAVKVIDSSGNALSAAETMLEDGCHPNVTGYAAIAQAFYNAINSKYSGTTSSTITNPTNVSMPSGGDAATLFSGSPYEYEGQTTFTLRKTDGYQMSFDNLPEKNSLGVEYVYYIKELGTHVLDSGGTFYTLSESDKQYISKVIYEHNGQLAADSGTVTINNTIKTTELNIKKVWDDENDHTGDTITVRVHRETVADSDDAQKNPLTLAMSVEDGSTIQIPIGNTDGIEITSNKGVNPNVTGAGIATPTTESASKKVWKIKPADNAQVGDKATVTFTDDSGQKITVNVEIVDNPTLAITLSSETATMGTSGSNVTSIQFTPPGEDTPITLNAADVTFTSGNTDILTIDANGVITPISLGKTYVQATYTYNGMPIVSNQYEVEVVYPSFTATDITVAVNETSQAQPNPSNYGTFTYEIKDTSIATVDGSGNVKGVAEDKTTLTITRSDGAKCEVNVNVTQAQTPTNNGFPYKYDRAITTDKVIKVTFKNNGTETVKFGGIYGASPQSAQSSDPGNGWVRDDQDWWIKYAYNISSLAPGAEITLEIPVETDLQANSELQLWWIQTLNGSDLDKEKYPLSATIETPTKNDGGGTSGQETTTETLEGFNLAKDDSTSTFTFDSSKVATKAIIYLDKEAIGDAYQQLVTTWYKGANNDWGGNNYSQVNVYDSIEIDLNNVALSKITFTPGNYNGDKRIIIKSVVIYYTTPTTVVQSANSRKLLSRFTSNTLRLGAALNYTSQPLSASNGAEETQAVIADFNDSDYMDITIKSTDGWQKLLAGLPVYKVNNDGTLKNYYYWAEEIAINGKSIAGYTVSYSFTDGDSETDYSINAANPGNALITIKNTPKEVATIELPESGGTGARIYYTIGGMLLLLSAAGYVITKRRRWSDG